MIKLTDLIKEANDDSEKGFRLKNTSTDPLTGKSESEVEYDPDVERIARELEGHRKEFKIISKSKVPEIKELAENIDIALHRIAKATYKLNELIQYNKKYKGV